MFSPWNPSHGCVCTPLESHGYRFNRFFAEYLGFCVYTPRDIIGVSIGFFNLLLISFVQLPQIWLNFNRKDSHGLAIGMLLFWNLGDIFGTIALTFTNQTRTTAFVQQVYCFFIDAILTFQWFLYHKKSKKSNKHTHDINGLSINGGNINDDEHDDDEITPHGQYQSDLKEHLLNNMLADSDAFIPFDSRDHSFDLQQNNDHNNSNNNQNHNNSNSKNKKKNNKKTLSQSTTIPSNVNNPQQRLYQSEHEVHNNNEQQQQQQQQSHTISAPSSTSKASMYLALLTVSICIATQLPTTTASLSSFTTSSSLQSLSQSIVSTTSSLSTSITTFTTQVIEKITNTVAEVPNCEDTGELKQWQKTLGTVSVFLCSLVYTPSQYPQIYQCWKSKRADMISTTTLIITVFGYIGWFLAYFLPTKYPDEHHWGRDFWLDMFPYVLSFISMTCSCLTLLFQQWLYKDNVPKSIDNKDGNGNDALQDDVDDDDISLAQRRVGVNM